MLDTQDFQDKEKTNHSYGRYPIFKDSQNPTLKSEDRGILGYTRKRKRGMCIKKLIFEHLKRWAVLMKHLHGHYLFTHKEGPPPCLEEGGQHHCSCVGHPTQLSLGSDKPSCQNEMSNGT